MKWIAARELALGRQTRAVGDASVDDQQPEPVGDLAVGGTGAVEVAEQLGQSAG